MSPHLHLVPLGCAVEYDIGAEPAAGDCRRRIDFHVVLDVSSRNRGQNHNEVSARSTLGMIVRRIPADEHSRADALLPRPPAGSGVGLLAVWLVARFLEWGLGLGVDVHLPELSAEGFGLLEMDAVGVKAPGLEVGDGQVEELGSRLGGCEDGGIDGGLAGLYKRLVLR